MRKCVTVIASFDTAGRVLPIKILWNDEALYEIDRILDIDNTVSLKGGGRSIRYNCVIRGQQRYLFYSDGIWFFER